MKPYETLFIVRPDIEEESLSTVVERVENVIKTNGGTPSEPQVWGRRRLAYEVKTYREGIYVLVSFESPPEVVGKLQEHFRFNEDVIRNIVTLQGPKPSEQDLPGEVAGRGPRRSEQDLRSEVTAQEPRRSEPDLPGEAAAQEPKLSELDLASEVAAQEPKLSEPDLPGEVAGANEKAENEVREG
jgi:small subunit ribosomal protein S6